MAHNDSVSLGALRLHAQALVASVADGHAGFVSDDYLARFGAGFGPAGGETAVAVLELCVAGVWSRADGGYRVRTG